MKMDLKVNEQNKYPNDCKKSTSNKVEAPNIDILLQSIISYTPKFYQKISILEANVSDVASENPTAIRQFNETLAELITEMNSLNQNAITLNEELNDFREIVQEQIREWAESTGMDNWQDEVEHMTSTMKEYMDSTTAEVWAEQKISICREDSQEIQKFVLKKIVTQNKYDYAVAGSKELATISNNIKGIQELLNEVSGADLVVILNLKLKALKLDWESLVSFINNINHKRYLLEDCDD